MFCLVEMICGVGQVKKGHLVDALAMAGDERRARLRKASGSCQETLIRGYLNGGTHLLGGILY